MYAHGLMIYSVSGSSIPSLSKTCIKPAAKPFLWYYTPASHLHNATHPAQFRQTEESRQKWRQKLTHQITCPNYGAIVGAIIDAILRNNSKIMKNRRESPVLLQGKILALLKEKFENGASVEEIDNSIEIYIPRRTLQRRFSD
jgi:hypothetical protein